LSLARRGKALRGGGKREGCGDREEKGDKVASVGGKGVIHSLAKKEPHAFGMRKKVRGGGL